MIAVPIAPGHIQNIKVCGMYIPFFFPTFSYTILNLREGENMVRSGYAIIEQCFPPFDFFFSVASWPAHEGSDMPEFLICDE